jgi:hypothetical protein
MLGYPPLGWQGGLPRVILTFPPQSLIVRCGDAGGLKP